MQGFFLLQKSFYVKFKIRLMLKRHVGKGRETSENKNEMAYLLDKIL